MLEIWEHCLSESLEMLTKSYEEKRNPSTLKVMLILVNRALENKLSVNLVGFSLAEKEGFLSGLRGTKQWLEDALDSLGLSSSFSSLALGGGGGRAKISAGPNGFKEQTGSAADRLFAGLGQVGGHFGSSGGGGGGGDDTDEESYHSSDDNSDGPGLD